MNAHGIRPELTYTQERESDVHRLLSSCAARRRQQRQARLWLLVVVLSVVFMFSGAIWIASDQGQAVMDRIDGVERGQ
jgi:hypothetical protein